MAYETSCDGADALFAAAAGAAGALAAVGLAQPSDSDVSSLRDEMANLRKENATLAVQLEAVKRDGLATTEEGGAGGQTQAGAQAFLNEFKETPGGAEIIAVVHLSVQDSSISGRN